MSELHPVAGPRTRPIAPRPTVPDVPTREAIRRGVQYLAFRVDAAGLQASYAPGPGPVSRQIACAAQAAVEVHRSLIGMGETGSASDPCSAVRAAHAEFARQLAEVKAGVNRAPTLALRSAYLDALAEFIIEAAGQDIPAASGPQQAPAGSLAAPRGAPGSRPGRRAGGRR